MSIYLQGNPQRHQNGISICIEVIWSTITSGNFEMANILSWPQWDKIYMLSIPERCGSNIKTHFIYSYLGCFLKYYCQMAQNSIHDISTLVQVMACCHKASNHHLKQCWPRSLVPYGINGPQCIKICVINISCLQSELTQNTPLPVMNKHKRQKLLQMPTMTSYFSTVFFSFRLICLCNGSKTSRQATNIADVSIGLLGKNYLVV